MILLLSLQFGQCPAGAACLCSARCPLGWLRQRPGRSASKTARSRGWQDVLAIGSSPWSCSGFLRARWLGSKVNVPRNRKEKWPISERLGQDAGSLVPPTCLGKGQRPYFLMRAGADLPGAVCKPQELVLQKGSVLPSHRPSLRADVLRRSLWCVQG